MAESTLRGRFVWHELLTSDPKAAASFYSRTLGWKVEPWDKDPAYTLFRTDQGLVGGAMTLPAEAKAAGAKPHWLSYIGTPDLKATVDAAHRHKIKVSVCGEMASDPVLAALLLGLGVDELSAAPALVPPVKFIIRRLKLTEAQELAEFALNCESAADILRRCQELARQVAPGLFEDK